MSWKIILEQFARQHSRNNKVIINYGTAGFREKSDLLDHVMFRMGILANLRSIATKATVGAMVTASHNPSCDNGIKLVDPKGEMLEDTWEQFSSYLANVDDDQIESVLEKFIEKHNISLDTASYVVFAKDTRESGESLSGAFVDGLKVFGSKYDDYGLLTTPQLHFVTVCRNNSNYGDSTVDGYFTKVVGAFFKLADFRSSVDSKYDKNCVLDCANGVGAIHALRLQADVKGVLDIDVRNSSRENLNHLCGADYVKQNQVVPTGIIVKNNTKYVSLDGDADRIIYFYVDDANQFHMLDGDKMACLFAMHFMKLAKDLNLNDFDFGIVQTAYANGSSTNYMTNTLGIPVYCVSTGVKHLHHQALKCDVGIYFEANGHGTVVFSDKVKSELRAIVIENNSGDQIGVLATTFLGFIDVINEAVGDALSDFLAIESILRYHDMSIGDWDAMYTDYPSKHIKVVVKDRSALTVGDADRICLTPEGLQVKIAELASKYHNGRAFARPSGTEDVIRVFAEANSKENCESLAQGVAALVYDFCGGIGRRPDVSK